MKKIEKKILRNLYEYKIEEDIQNDEKENLINSSVQTNCINNIQFGQIHNVSSKIFVTACLSNGIGLTAGRDFSTKIGVKVPVLSKCYATQKQIKEKIHQMARNCVDHYATQITTPRSLGFDGSWSHCRKAPQCFGCFMDLLSKKIVDYYVVEKSTKWSEGNYNGTSQGIETECFSKL